MAAKLPQFALLGDWETSGAVQGPDGAESATEYQGISYGGIVVNLEDLQPVEDIYFELQFDETKFKWSDGAQKVHGLTREHLAQHGITREEGAIRLASLQQKYWGTSAVPYMGHNVRFDIAFTKDLLYSHGLFVPVHRLAFDTSPLFALTFGLHTSNEIFEFCGLDKRQAHNALEDCYFELASFQFIKETFKACLGN